MLTENDFDKLIIVMKGLRYTFIWSPRSRVRDVVMFPIVSKPILRQKHNASTGHPHYNMLRTWEELFLYRA
jgi:hypothetical protein